VVTWLALSSLNRKLVRDLWEMRSQALAIARSCCGLNPRSDTSNPGEIASR